MVPGWHECYMAEVLKQTIEYLATQYCHSAVVTVLFKYYASIFLLVKKGMTCAHNI